MQANTSDEFRRRILSQPAALKYLWARHAFVSRHPRNLYWFVFWDDFWNNNYKTKILKVRSRVKLIIENRRNPC